MSVAIHQLLPVLTPGDAIGGAVLSTQTMLEALGYRSEIYADVIDASLRGVARPASELSESLLSTDAVLYHLSVGSRLAHVFSALPARRVVVYHNITPAQYFESTSPKVVLELQSGRRELVDLATRSELCIADSEYNAEEARHAGYPRVVVVPPPVDLQRLAPVPARPVAPPYALFVGRFAVNKRHDTLLRALAVLVAEGSDLHLTLVGPQDDNRAYVSALRRFADRLRVTDRLDLRAGRVSDRELHLLYRGASAFVTASEHEGFCVPLVEAMAFGLPIVARAAAAIPSTVGDAGLLINGDDPLLMAAALARVLQDDRLRDALVSAGHRRLTDFSHASVKGRLSSALALVGLGVGV